jgi:CPA2 family monovalent cation:H+ antiporter-2
MSFSFLQTVQQLSPPLMSFGDQLFFHVSASSSSDTLIQDFAAIMIVAAIMLVITHRLKQPMVIGYLVAGMIIGPYTPPFSI